MNLLGTVKDKMFCDQHKHSETITDAIHIVGFQKWLSSKAWVALEMILQKLVYSRD